MEKFCIDKIEFFVLNIDVEEKINSKNIKRFIFTSLEVAKVSDYKKYNILYNYIEELKIYQIILYLDSLPCLNLLSNSNDKLVVFSYKSYIFVYKDSKFYYFFNINYSLSLDEIRQLISNKLKINIKNIIKLNAIQNINPKIEYKNIIKPYIFSYLTSFFLLSLFCLFTLLLFIYFNKNEKVKPVNKNIKHFASYEYKVLDLINIVKLTNTYDLLLDEVSFENNKYTLFLSSKNIDKIHNFLDSKVYEVDVKSLTYNKQRQKNELICTIDKI